MDYKIKTDKNNKKYLETDSFGYDLISHPRWNKGTAFSEKERDIFELHGLLPSHQFSLNVAVEKRYASLVDKITNLEKHIYLRAIQDRNETLFYALLDKHIEELMPIIYTPTVGEACQQYSSIYRRPRGIFISYSNRDKMDAILANPSFDDVEVIVVSDGERILGLGDQGAGGMGIPIGKLSLYTACAGIAPEKTLPILLDVGTDNQNLLSNPVYLGLHHTRIKGKEYDDFIEQFIKAVKKRFPNVLLQWEDFAQHNAGKLLNKYQNELCSFNDDIQGTAAIMVSALIASINASKLDIHNQVITIAGAGSAGVGISNFLVEYMKSIGISEQDAYAKIFLIDRNGLLTENIEVLDFQKPFVKTNQQLSNWKISNKNNISLQETVLNAKTTLLVGVSGQGGIFTEEIIKCMAKNCEYPIVFPLSNPTQKAEANPHDVLKWTKEKAIIGTGTPFPKVTRNGELKRIDQVNNCYIFPGVGLGAVVVKPKVITNKMFLLAAIKLAEFSPSLNNPSDNILPSLDNIREISKHIAFVVAKEAITSGLTNITNISDDELIEKIEKSMWKPEYIDYVRLPKK
ncbi:NAD-dependent malic enzyme [Rickettsiales bacterium LUAb2]